MEVKDHLLSKAEVKEEVGKSSWKVREVGFYVW
jgi:hypothetical protein